MRDSRTFGRFAELLLRDADISTDAKILVAEHAFELLPLPQAEGDVFLVDSRASSGLLDLAAFLLRREAFTVLQFMHLLYAVFLDRTLVTNVERSTRSEVLASVASLDEFPEGPRVLYSSFHLAALPEREQKVEFGTILRGSAPRTFRQTLARIAASEDGGVGEVARIAQAEGLVPDLDEGPSNPTVLVNIPRLSSRLAAPALKWLARSREGSD